MARVLMIAILLFAKPVLAEECTAASTSPQQPTATYVSETTLEISFVESARVAGYEVRYVEDEPITDDTFAGGTLVDTGLVPMGAGAVQTFAVEVEPYRYYSFGIRAIGPCPSPMVVVGEAYPGCVCGCASAGAGESAMLAAIVALVIGRRHRRR